MGTRHRSRFPDNWPYEKGRCCILCRRPIVKGDIVRDQVVQLSHEMEAQLDTHEEWEGPVHLNCFTGDIPKRRRCTSKQFNRAITLGVRELRARRRMEKQAKRPEPVDITQPADKKSTKKKSKKTAKKSTKSKAKKVEGGKARSMARSIGQKLTDLKFSKQKSVVKALASDKKVTNAQLSKLRDDINKVALQLREDGDGSTASALSSINRLVRRLERASR